MCMCVYLHRLYVAEIKTKTCLGTKNFIKSQQ